MSDKVVNPKGLDGTLNPRKPHDSWIDGNIFDAKTLCPVLFPKKEETMFRISAHLKDNLKGVYHPRSLDWLAKDVVVLTGGSKKLFQQDYSLDLHLVNSKREVELSKAGNHPYTGLVRRTGHHLWPSAEDKKRFNKHLEKSIVLMVTASMSKKEDKTSRIYRLISAIIFTLNEEPPVTGVFVTWLFTYPHWMAEEDFGCSISGKRFTGQGLGTFLLASVQKIASLFSDETWFWSPLPSMNNCWPPKSNFRVFPKA